MNTLSERLAYALQDAGMTQADLGRAVGVSRSAISQILAQQCKGMKPEHLIRACRVLRVRPEWLVLGEDPMRPMIVSQQDRLLWSAYQALPPTKQATVASVVRDLSSSTYT